MVRAMAWAGALLLRARDRYAEAARALSGAGLWLLVAGMLIAALLVTTQLFIVGVIVGSIFALGAIGLTLIYGILKFGNFAHGDLMMLGGYIAYFVLTGLVVGERDDVGVPWSLDELPGALDKIGALTFGYGLLLAALVAALVLALLSVGLDRLIYRPLRRRGAGIVIFAIVSLGVAIAVRSILLIVWGPDPRFYVLGVHPAHQFPFGITLKADQIFSFAVAVVLMALTYLLLFRTKLGKAMRAMSDNADLARISGIDTERVVLWTWVIGGALVAVAGVLLGLQAQLKPELGFLLILPLFAAAILGGIGSPQGALVGAMIVGVTQEVSVEFVSSGYKPAVAFIILILILLLRPRGLFGARA